nr:MAG: ORF1 [Torque teno midi virus]
MPFWWRRRQKWWRGRRRQWYRPKRKYKRRRRPLYRRKYRRFATRRRKRRKKVRRKLKKLPVKVWQPDSIRKCKIKGLITHILGGEGKQLMCYTDEQFKWTPPKAPAGGGFGFEVYTLQYLYQQYRMGNNIWTHSNINYDLARYTGGKIRFYRHPYMSFIISYQLSYPMVLEKYSYANCHPKSQLLFRHKKLVLSKKAAPNKKNYVTIRFKPPKLMSTKWFFQESLANTGLILLRTSICDTMYPDIGPLTTNQLTTVYALNLQFYVNGGWGNAGGGAYMPYASASQTFTGQDINGKQITGTIKTNTYQDSIDYSTGWFQSKFLLLANRTDSGQVIPTTAGRYNPTVDDGVGNKVWLSSVLNNNYDKPTSDKAIILEGLPLYQLLFGFLNWCTRQSKDPNYLDSYIVVISSKYILPYHDIGTRNYYVPIDRSFIEGKGPYGEYVTALQKKKWFPTVKHQMETLNSIVETGSYIPRLNNERYSTWQLKSYYTFYFKWGGAQQPDAEATDPSKQARYDVPDKIKQAIQIGNPSKQTALSTLHSWDYRRGLLTPKAYRRMLENQQTDTTFQTDTEEPPKKKPKTNQVPIQTQEQEEIESCLLSLFKEDSYQETQQIQEQNILQLIQQQQQKQHHLRDNLLKLIADMKKQQAVLQLQSGLLN